MPLLLIIITTKDSIVKENNMIIDANAFTLRDNPKRSILQIWSGKVVSVPVVRKATMKSSKDNVKVSNALAMTAGAIIGKVIYRKV